MVSSWCVGCLGDDGIHIKYLNQDWHLGWYRHGLYRYQNGIYINININHMMIRVSGRPLSSPQGTVPTERMSRLSARRRQPGGSGNPPWQCGSFSHDSHVDGEFFHGRVWFNPEANIGMVYPMEHPFLDLWILWIPTWVTKMGSPFSFVDPARRTSMPCRSSRMLCDM